MSANAGISLDPQHRVNAGSLAANVGKDVILVGQYSSAAGNALELLASVRGAGARRPFFYALQLSRVRATAHPFLPFPAGWAGQAARARAADRGLCGAPGQVP